jgi:hypothetical protein
MSVFHTHLRAGKVDSVNRLVVGVIIADAVTGENMPVLMYVCPNCHKMEFFFSR